jgi:hypothetical protein
MPRHFTLGFHFREKRSISGPMLLGFRTGRLNGAKTLVEGGRNLLPFRDALHTRKLTESGQGFEVWLSPSPARVS